MIIGYCKINLSYTKFCKSNEGLLFINKINNKKNGRTAVPWSVPDFGEIDPEPGVEAEIIFGELLCPINKGSAKYRETV